ncbi:hypothetical protein AWENTII_009769 [Aspergillus wentii]
MISRSTSTMSCSVCRRDFHYFHSNSHPAALMQSPLLCSPVHEQEDGVRHPLDFLSPTKISSDVLSPLVDFFLSRIPAKLSKKLSASVTQAVYTDVLFLESRWQSLPKEKHSLAPDLYHKLSLYMDRYTPVWAGVEGKSKEVKTAEEEKGERENGLCLQMGYSLPVLSEEMWLSTIAIPLVSIELLLRFIG